MAPTLLMVESAPPMLAAVSDTVLIVAVVIAVMLGFGVVKLLDYLRKRDALRQIVTYVAAKRERTDPAEASAARILGTAIQTERI